MPNFTFKAFEQILLDICTNDMRVRSARIIDEWNANTRTDDDYTIVLYDFTSQDIKLNQRAQQYIEYTVHIAVMDQLLADRTNMADVISHTADVLAGVIAQLRSSSTLRNLGIRFVQPNVQIQQAAIRGDDNIAGCHADIVMQFAPSISGCDVPSIPLEAGANDYDVASPVSLLCAQLTNCGVIQTIQANIDELYTLTGGTGGAATYITPGTNAYTGGTASNPIVGVIGSPAFTAVTANSFISGSTNLQDLFAISAHTHVSSAITDSSYGGHDITDANKLVKFNLEGQIAASVKSSTTAAISAYSFGNGFAGYFDSNHENANILVQQNGTGPGISTTSAYGFGAEVYSQYGRALYVQAGNHDIAQFASGITGAVQLTVLANGALKWSSTTGANVTRNNLGVPYALPGNQITTGGTALAQTINLVPSPSLTNISVSGVSYGATVSGNTFYSGSTSFNDILSSLAGGGTPTYITPGTNAYTGGTASNPIVGVIGSPVFTAVTATLITSKEYYSAETSLNDILSSFGPSTYITPGTNIYTGGTASNPIVGVIGSPVFTAVTATSVSGTSVSATTFYSGSTDLSTLLGQGSTPTYVQPGTNAYTGGTASNPIVGVIGSPVFTAVTATDISGTSISATTIYSGNTDISSVFSTKLLSTYSPSTTSYTLALSDSGRFVDFTGSTQQYCVIPANASIAFPIGTQLLVGRYGTGALSISASTGVSMNSFSGYTALTGQYAVVTLIKQATDRWRLSGQLS